MEVILFWLFCKTKKLLWIFPNIYKTCYAVLAKPPNGLRYLRWGGRRNAVRLGKCWGVEKCLESHQNPQRRVHALLARFWLGRLSDFVSFSLLPNPNIYVKILPLRLGCPPHPGRSTFLITFADEKLLLSPVQLTINFINPSLPFQE